MDNHNAYDKKSKRLLSKKSIIVQLMKGCIPEYKGLSEQEILRCIEDGNVNDQYITGLPLREASIEDAEVEFDVLFTAKIPGSDERIGLYIDIEPQKNSNPGYPVIKRAIYYAARLLDRQKGIVFKKSENQKLRKVYSIWICINPPKRQADTINEYLIQEINRRGHFREFSENYDLIDIIILNVGSDYNYTEQGNDLLKLLGLLFTNTTLTKDEVSKRLNDAYGIMLTGNEVAEMTAFLEGLLLREEQIKQEAYAEAHAKGLADGLAEGLVEGRAVGRVEGREEGRKEGRAEERLIAIKNLFETCMEFMDKESALAKVSAKYNLSAEEIERLN